MQVGVEAAGHHDGTTVGNGVDEVVDVAAADGGDLAAFPDRLGAAVDDLFDPGVGAIVGLVALEPFVGYCGEAVGCGWALMLRALALVDCGAGVAPCFAGGGERHAGPASQRHPFLIAEQPIEIDPALAAAVADSQSEAGIALVEVIGLTAGRRSNAFYSGCGEGPVGHRVT